MSVVSDSAESSGIQPLWPDMLKVLAEYAYAYIPVCSLERFAEIIAEQVPGCPAWAPRVLYKKLRPNGPKVARGGTEADVVVLD